jgi:hypothetical protein
MLPDVLPTDPGELEKLYQDCIAQDQVDQADLERLTEARLRAWGYDPQHLSAEQLLGLMEESINHLMMNLYGALDAAPDSGTRHELEAIITQAQELRGQIGHIFDETNQPPSAALDG